MATTCRAVRALPDPIRAHGAWIYLFASVAAGAITAAHNGIETALLVGTGFVGAFLCVAALTAGPQRKGRQLVVGAALTVLMPLAALWLGAERAFLAVAACAVVVAAAAVLLALRRGILSRATLVTGIAALVLVAPAVALSGGVRPARAALLFVLLWLFFSWRSLRIGAPLEAGARWDPAELRARGLREAGITALWMLVVATMLA